MTIPPFSPDPEKTRVHFRALRELRDRLEHEVGMPLPELSMGMSHDLEIAIQEGHVGAYRNRFIWSKRMKITFIGAGNMSEAIIAGVLKQEVVAADAVTVSDPLEERLKHMQQAYGIHTEEDNVAQSFMRMWLYWL